MPSLLRALLPPVTTALALQAAAGLPSIAAKSDRIYDLSGSLTFLAVGALSLYMPRLVGPVIPGVISVLRGQGPTVLRHADWRQLVLTGAVAIWATRLGSYLFARVLQNGHDSRFDEIKTSAPKFAGAFFGQALWVSLCLSPVILLNAVPPAVLSAAVPKLLLTDVLGLTIWACGFACEVIADRQKSAWMKEKKEKLHDEDFMTRGLFSRSQFPNYFGEITLWTGIATVAAGILARQPVQLALGLSGSAGSILTTTALSYVSPAFAALLLTKVSGIPLSEEKYDKRYGHRKDYQEWKKNTPKLIPRFW
ncbi:S5A-REDUCTASE domain-containing protein [Fusarium keratoplasticum]|uniref:S5A-REDUCTASE domain-containing protein n=1 Tax=Fusarium keratoplasticum TaxID=1328300 RepID=A0ACC0R9S2_9HYPO|nr:S5A-REDUCTASE domain-containing protein [Fusarium keratoplasticum]KAI8680181.1 S5A-REDUCTASE domain-containing protein [Fusarium keratoplasticum]